MNILRRNLPEVEPAKDEKNPDEMHRRIEVTVEREWVSMLVRQRPTANAEQPPPKETCGVTPGTEPEIHPLHLPSSVPKGD